MKLLYLLSLTAFLFACGGAEKMENGVVDTATIFPNHAEKAPAASPPPAAANNTTTPDTAVQPHATTPSSVEVKTFQNQTTDDANKTWGYDIYMNGALYIHQPSMPAVAGIRGFKIEADARTAGEFVAYKIKHNILPPSVTPQELDSIGVLR